MMLTGTTLVPAILTLPAAAVLLVVVAGHLLATMHRTEPASRRRIRTANGFVVLVTIPLLAMGFSVIDPDRYPTEWLLVWLAAIALLSINVGLALLDIANTIRLTLRSRRDLRTSLRVIHHDAVRRKLGKNAASGGGAEDAD